MDAALLDILRHALGTGDDGTRPPFRNHFVTGEGSTDHPLCLALVERGLMKRRTGNAISGGDDIFSVTANGRLAAAPADGDRAFVPHARSKQRYADFLHADSGLSFGEWLRARRYKLYKESTNG